MGKVAQSSVKYLIEAKLVSTGLVEKPDIVGAIFGQTEGLLGDELDLRELQERGQVGRIDVNVVEKEGNSEATVKIPTSLNATETALLGASLETIARVGPTEADITVEAIMDQRTTKRDYIVKRAKQLLEGMEKKKPEKGKMTDEIKSEVRKTELSEYKGFKAGPETESAEEVILVEGRADLLNLLSHGVRNALALGGTSIPDNIGLVPEDKNLTAFLDGDRGGDLILKELKQKSDPDYVARAPENKEVEELGKEDVYKALRDKEPVKFVETAEEDEDIDEKTFKQFEKYLNDLIGTRAIAVLNEDFEVSKRLPIDNKSDLKSIGAFEGVIVDGEVDGDLISVAEDAEASYVVGMKKSGYANSSDLEILTRDDVENQLGE